MSEETKVVEPTNQQAEEKTETSTEPTVEKAKEMTFTQQQLDNIIKQRLDAEQRKHNKALEETKKAEEEALKEKQIQEAKTKADLENLMKQRIAEKDNEINRYKIEMKKERVDNSILSVASQNKAISPTQVVSLMKDKVRLTDDNRVEILDNNSNVRYNPQGELLTIEESVKEFLDSNPHFRQGSLSGSGSQSAIEGKTVKPFNIQDLDMSKPEDRAKYSEYRKERDSKPTQINLTNK
nr:Phage minor structural protein GP20 [uncultured Mediterranean phage uvMED]